MAGKGSVDLPQSGKTGTREEPRGLLGEIQSLLGSLTRYFQALGALAGEESKEALALGLRLGLALIAALFFAGFGFVLLVITVAFFAANVLGVSWLWILGGFTALHLLLALICVNQVRKHFRTPIFEATRREISNDLETLRKTPKP